MNKLPNLAIVTPFYNEKRALPDYLEHLKNLDYPKSKLGISWVDNSSTDNTLSLLKAYRRQFGSKYKWFRIRQTPHLKSLKLSFEGHNNIVISVRTMIKDIKEDCVFIGADCYPPPNGILRLNYLVQKKGADIAGGITLVGGGNINTGRYKLSNVPVISAYFYKPQKETFESISLVKRTKPHLLIIPAKLVNNRFKVGGVGTGFAFIKREVLDNIPFEFSAKFGEDLWFCLMARMQGYRIWVDTSLWYEHWHIVYRRRMLRDGRLQVETVAKRDKKTGSRTDIYSGRIRV